ncbi:hypothetical protein [Sphaerisporangium corydalis]|uniref:Uncharacterized protein n=1 Tax=Sphaerisporangium corydalis TaxID=1441875 RepID=A0ABV9E8T9_9ACTN|nr:hypothetical protein [Sphaerisporangium corydalis]
MNESPSARRRRHGRPRSWISVAVFVIVFCVCGLARIIVDMDSPSLPSSSIVEQSEILSRIALLGLLFLRHMRSRRIGAVRRFWPAQPLRDGRRPGTRTLADFRPSPRPELTVKVPPRNTNTNRMTASQIALVTAMAMLTHG